MPKKSRFIFSRSNIFEPGKMNFFELFVPLAVILASCESVQLDSREDSSNDDRIVDGFTAARGQFPYMASLRHPARKGSIVIWRHKCGGAILNNRWILSCAYCTHTSNTSNIAIVVGAHHIQNDGGMYSLERIVNHPAYKPATLKNNICLLQTRKSIPFNLLIQPILLGKDWIRPNAATTISGWGMTMV